MHFAFVGESRHPALGVGMCAGPTRGDAESEEEFAARRTQWSAVCAAMHALQRPP
jgi:hypothetical protein